MPLLKNASPISSASPSALKAYILASRPKTWIASISPVLIGNAFAPSLNRSILALTLLFSFLIQVGTNYANDYFDFVKGVDSHLRNGPKRATQEGWIEPKSMFTATLIVFSLALVIAIPLMIQAGLWSLFLVLLCIAFGILYTGGPMPLGYLGLGEVFVFVFFGPVATCGSYFLQTGSLNMPILIGSLAPGFLSCSILIANNLRDEKSDRIAKKNTLVVRFGKTFGSWEYTYCILLASLTGPILALAYSYPTLLIGTIFLTPISIPSIKKVFFFHDPFELISVLQKSASYLFFYTLLYLFALW